MKTLILLLICSSYTFSSMIEKNVNEICKIAHSCESFDVDSNQMKSAIYSYAMELEGEDLLDENYLENATSLPDPGEVDYGTFSMRLALDLVSSHEETLTPSQIFIINGFILKMIGTGVEFGFTWQTGGSVCGMSFPGLLIFDKKEKKLFDISLFGYPQC